MTFEDDFVSIKMQGGTRRWRCKGLGIEWPPPELIDIEGFKFKRERYSQITDEQRETMTHVCRGAEYEEAT